MKMAVESMEMAPGALPRPDRVSEQRLMSPELGFLVAAELRSFSGEIVDSFRVFGAGAIYRPKGNARACTRRPHHVAAPPPSRPRDGMVRRPWDSAGLALLAPWVFWRNRISVIFLDFSEHFGFRAFSAIHRHNKQKLALWHLVNRLVQ